MCVHLHNLCVCVLFFTSPFSQDMWGREVDGHARVCLLIKKNPLPEELQ